MRLAHCRLEGLSGHEAGRQLLARLYREETGDALPQIRVDEKGKPHFAQSPLHFSITHTPHHAFCALSRENIGIDAEELDRPIRWKLADKILSPGERQQYEAAPDKARAFLTFWVLKEAEAKLTGEGLRIYPNHTNFSLDDPRVAEIDGCLVAILTEE
ncbi:MAG: 4'-phosphopantetheinyl transferase family protein [Faecousia sp.]